MNVLNIFEQRISAIFMEGAPGARAPFSFKRLAKRAVREMEDETFVIDGVDTAPALYTVLISARDDELMRHMYIQITEEISQLVEAQAKKRGYTFVGKPLVRFMVDPALRSGRFSVFAENIDPRTLARLRDEENAYLGITPPREIYPEQSFVPEYVPVAANEPAYVVEEPAFVPEPIFSDEPVEPEVATTEEPASIDEVPQISAEFQQLDKDLAANQVVTDEVVSEFLDDVEMEEPEAPLLEEQAIAEPQDEAEPEVVPAGPTPEVEVPAQPSPEPVPVQAVEAEKPEHMAAHVAPATPEPQPAVSAQPAVAAPPTCRLIDLGSGATYSVTTAHSIMGRERTAGGVVLRDPNVSRRHAELVFANGAWRIVDLGSTNGTLVNDVDVREADLHNGDVLTIGLVNLEFRAG